MTDDDQTETSPAQGVLPLPGVETVERGSASDLEHAVRRTLAELQRQGHIAEIDAGKLQLAIELAQVVSIKKRTGRASTIGNDARVLMEILDSFVEEATDVDDGLRDAMAQWTDYLARQQ